MGTPVSTRVAVVIAKMEMLQFVFGNPCRPVPYVCMYGRSGTPSVDAMAALPPTLLRASRTGGGMLKNGQRLVMFFYYVVSILDCCES